MHFSLEFCSDYCDNFLNNGGTKITKLENFAWKNIAIRCNTGNIVNNNCYREATVILLGQTRIIVRFQVADFSTGICGVPNEVLYIPMYAILVRYGSVILMGAIPISALFTCNFVFIRALAHREKNCKPSAASKPSKETKNNDLSEPRQEIYRKERNKRKSCFQRCSGFCILRIIFC